MATVCVVLRFSNVGALVSRSESVVHGQWG